MEEKKESGIAKLIELLNEYHHFNSDLIYYGWDEEYEKVYFHSELPEKEKEKLRKAGIDMEDDGVDEDWMLDEWICGKRFGFIQWLVDNDKIDFGNLKIEEIVAGTDLYYIFNNYEVLLMLLSIQDEPIDFLCKIIK